MVIFMTLNEQGAYSTSEYNQSLSPAFSLSMNRDTRTWTLYQAITHPTSADVRREDGVGEAEGLVSEIAVVRTAWAERLGGCPHQEGKKDTTASQNQHLLWRVSYYLEISPTSPVLFLHP
jgi:hypothetical protein